MSSGTRLSSVVARRHLSTPRAEPVGKALEGSLRPRVDSAEKSCLLMLGCVLNWKPGFSPMRSGSVTLPMAESVMSSVRSPLTSIDSSPPSRFIETTTFSSTVSWMASLITRLAGAAPPAPPAGPAGLPGMPMGASSTSPVSTSCCSREAPPPIVFLPSAMPVPLASGFWYVGGRSMPMPPMPPMPIDESIPAPLGIVTGPADEMPGISDDGIEPMPPLLPRAPPLLRAISFSFSLAFSRASRSLLCRIIRLSLHGQKATVKIGYFWRRIARTPEAAPGRPVAQPLPPESVKPPRAARRALRRHGSRARAPHRGGGVMPCCCASPRATPSQC
eukprot:scaffold29843_cov63-Phaeocystis_antarctica.AAC.13